MFPLSASQQIVWLQQKVVPDSRAYHATAVIDFHGEINPTVLRQCIVDAVGRHDAMRVQICDEDAAIARQEVAENLHIEIPEHDLRGAEDLEGQREDLLRQHVHAEFDLRTAPLARWTLVRLSESHWQLFVTEHHLVHDGRSTVEFLSDVLGQYSAEVSGKHFARDAAPSYEDYVAYTASGEYRAIVAADVEWWREQLDGANFSIEFPGLGSRRSALFDHRGGQYRQALSADLMDAVRALARESGQTVFSALLAVYAELCRRHSGQHDLVIGLPVANRPAGFERTVGMMVSAVPLRLAVDPRTPGSEVAADAMTAIFDAIDHEAAPTQDLVKALKRSSRGLVNPLFNIMFGMHDGPCPTVDVPGLSVDMQVALSANSTKFDLSVVVMPDKVLHGDSGDRAYELVWEYSTQLFGPEDVELLATQFEALLRAYVADPSAPIGTLAPAVVAPSVRDDRAEHEGLRTADAAASAAAEPGQPEAESVADGTRPAPAADPGEYSESLWLQAFRDILERDDIDDDTDFFRAGGYSLLVPVLLSHYESLSGWRPPTSLLFEFSSPLQLEAASAARRQLTPDLQR
ncbi:condensation domain-containing protein [Streptomyces viridochromogenes]|uniref:condensation domain-containing protein n=1 Tax=Streptomyces viridochromogenes TaxID=1938 RepID=UPI00069DA51A|nr:condensation domain-containing protein [Streptomyces viridochromogenes]KOG25050.1 thioester reductase [Streptomyces viridochromogenes]KOG26517.1 thioester reductase [Streptomyces viridochromogenes]